MSKMLKFFRWGLVGLMMLSTLSTVGILSGCQLYRLGMNQGNMVDEKAFAQVKVGMSPTEVRNLIGTALIQDTFGRERWSYVLYKRTPQGAYGVREVSLFFDQGQLIRIEGPIQLGNPEVINGKS